MLKSTKSGIARDSVMIHSEYMEPLAATKRFKTHTAIWKKTARKPTILALFS